MARHNGATPANSNERDALLALRLDPAVSSDMAAALARDNSAALRASLGRAPDDAELYLAHFLGASGAGKLLGSDPAQSAAAILPQAAAANRGVFYTPGGAPRSAGDVVALVRGRMDAAKGQGGGVSAPVVTNITATRASPAPRASMADTLRSAFGDSAPGLSPAAQSRVGNAYNKLKALGL